VELGKEEAALRDFKIILEMEENNKEVISEI
jgi:hypothetical protein